MHGASVALRATPSASGLHESFAARLSRELGSRPASRFEVCGDRQVAGARCQTELPPVAASNLLMGLSVFDDSSIARSQEGVAQAAQYQDFACIIPMPRAAWRWIPFGPFHGLSGAKPSARNP